MEYLRMTFAMCALALAGNASAGFIQSPIPPSLYNNYFRDADGDGKMDRIELYFLGSLTAENLAQTLDSLSYTWVDENGAIDRNVIPRSALAFDTASARRLFYDLPQTISVHKDLTEFDLSSYGPYGAVELYHTDAGSVPDSVNVQMKDGMPPAIREVFLSMAQNGGKAEDTLTVSFTESVMEEQAGSALFECKSAADSNTKELSANILRWSNDRQTVILTGKNLAADSIRIRETALKDSAGNKTPANSAFHGVNATYPILIYTNTKAEMQTNDSLKKLPNFQWIFTSQGDTSPTENELGVAIDAGGPEAATAIRDALRRNRAQQTKGLDLEEISVDPSKLSFSMELRVFTNSGDYVTGTHGEIQCTDSRFSASGNGMGNCITNPKRLLLRWNFMASDRRLVGTGAYIAQFPVRVTYDGITLYRSDKSGKFLQTWGVLRR